MVLVK